MKLVEIQLGQAIRLVPLSGRRGNLYGPNLAHALEKHYGFLQGPRTLPEWDISKGIAFLHGIYRDIVIDKLTLFPDGIVCETKVNTTIADDFIEDAARWAREDAGFPISDAEVAGAPRAYASRVNVQMNVALDRAVHGFSELGKGIASAMSGYGQRKPEDYGVAAVHLHVDNAANGPPPFMLERTINQPWESGMYFSGAPLRTDDHVRLLEALEATLSTL